MSRRFLAFCALISGLLLAACGDEPVKASSPQASFAACDAPIPFVYPDRWLALAERARDRSCAPKARVSAIVEMGRAGPQANLVLPTLQELAAKGEPPAVCDAAKRSIVDLP